MVVQFNFYLHSAFNNRTVVVVVVTVVVVIVALLSRSDECSSDISFLSNLLFVD